VGQDSSELKNLTEWDTWHQEMPQWSRKDIIGGSDVYWTVHRCDS